MQIADIYPFVLTLVMVGMILGVGILVLGKFAATSGLTTDAATALNSTVDALTPVSSTWLPLIVTVSVLAIILGIVLTSFGGSKAR